MIRIANVEECDATKAEQSFIVDCKKINPALAGFFLQHEFWVNRMLQIVTV